MTLGTKLQQLRKQKRFSQEELAQQLNVSRQAVSKWELDESKPDTDNVILLSKLYSVSTDFLLIDEFVSDSNIPAVTAIAETLTSEYRNGGRSRTLKRIAYALICFGLCGIMLVYTTSRFVESNKRVETWYGPAEAIIGTVEEVAPQSATDYTVSSGSAYTYIKTRGDLLAFVQTYRLEALFILCCLAPIAGVALLKQSGRRH
jgi:transcriptional regulator with XRE-family HTH domain